MICKKCKKEIDNNSKVCSNCNSAVEDRKGSNSKLIIILIVILVIVTGVLGVVGLTNNTDDVINNDNSNNEDNLVDYEEINVNDLKITLNGKEYKISEDYKLSDFINDGWELENGIWDFLEIDKTTAINMTHEEINKAVSSKYEGMTTGYNAIALKQNNLLLTFGYDNSELNTKIIDSKIIYMSHQYDETINTETLNYDFFGLKVGKLMTLDQFHKMFGNKNVEVTSSNDGYSYYKTTQLDNGTVIKVSVTTQLDTDVIKSIAIDKY